MRTSVLPVCISGLTPGARAHDENMPVEVHLAERSWLMLALMAMLSPLRRRHC